jgi:hypothetical protein
MKRGSVLLLVALLMPIRGVLATVGLFCHVGASVSLVATQGHHHDAAHHASPHSSPEGHHQHAVGLDAPVQSDTFKYCTAVYSIPPVAPADADYHLSVAPRGERFAALEVPPLSPYLSGLERPPRSI